MSDVKKCEFTCDICRDLIPLVKDGVASADSENAVRIHLKSCPVCSENSEFAAIFEGKPIPEPPESSPNKALIRLKQWLTLMYSVILLFGLYFALSLTGSRDVNISLLIMPFAGVFGYLAMRWRAVYILPVIMLILQVLMNETGNMKSGHFIEFGDLVKVLLIYYLLALAGMVITVLLKFAFGKTKFEWGEDDER